MSFVHGVFQGACVRHGRNAAVVGGDVRWTYQELDTIARRIAGGLAAAGVGPGTFVPVFVERSAWFIATVLGVLKRGAAYVPIDPSYPIERQRAVLNDLGATVGIGGGEGAATAGGLLRILNVHELVQAAPVADVEVDRDAPAYVMYTSGSTGRPKGTVIPHRGIVRLVRDADYAEFGPGHTWAVMSSVSFDASTLEIWGALLNGGCCAVLEDRLPSIERIAEVFARHRVTDAWITAALFNTIVDYRVEMFRGMRQVFSGGEAESPKHFRRFIEACPGVRLIHGYGPTENTTFSLCHTVTAEDVAAGERIPIGKPIHGTEILILGEGGRECTGGESGELYVGGDGVGLGYLGQEDLTRAKFVMLKGRDGTWYRTGDLVRRRADGAVMFLGRIDRQVKIRGFRVEPEEVEKVLGACPQVAGVSVDVAGESSEEKNLVAYCAVKETADLECAKERVAEWLRERLPSYMIPGEFYFVQELPRTPNGKVDRALLDRMCRRRAGGETNTVVEIAGVEGDEAATLEDIWRDLLPGLRVTKNTDFFAEGGHSVLVLKMVAELQRRLGRIVAPSVVYRERTFGRIAEAVRTSGLAEPESHRPPDDTATDHPCGRVQSGLLYEWWLDPTSSAYHVFTAFVVEPGFDAGAFERSLERSIGAHDALRSVFYMSEAGPRQKFLERVQLDDVIRVEAATDWDGIGAVLESVLASIREPFEVTTGPLIRVHMFPMSGGRKLIVIVMHHAIIDEWSLELILSELEGGEPVSPRSVMSYVRWEKGRAEIEEARRRGQELLGTLGAADMGAGAGASAAVELLVDLGSDLAQEVERFAVALGTTPFVVLLSAYAVTLSSCQGVSDPWIVTPFANRTNAGLRGVVGCCIDLRLLRIGAGNGVSFAEVVRRTHEAVVREHDLGPVPLDEVAGIVRHATGLPIDACMRFAMTYRVGAMRGRRLGGVAAQAARMPVARAKFGLLVQFEHEPQSLRFAIEARAGEHTIRELRDFTEKLRSNLSELLRDAGVGRATAAGSGASEVGRSIRSAARLVAVDESLQTECVRAWSRVLGAASPQTSDDFFRAGGTSLMLIRLSAELKKITGQSLDVAAFLIEPTLGRVAGLLHLDEDPTVVTLGGGGGRFVVVAFPGNLGPATACHTLAKELRRLVPGGYEFVGVDLRMLRRSGASFAQTMESLASTLEHHLAGRRFAMVGSSLGGIVAFDLAAKFSRRGHGTRRVWLLDSYAPEPRWREAVRGGAATGLVLARSPLAGLRRIGRRIDDWRWSRPGEERGKFVVEDGMESCEGSRPGARISVGIAKNLLSGYVPEVIDADVVVLRSIHWSRPVGSYFRGQMCGWGPFVKGNVKCAALDIPHAGFMSGSGAGDVVRIIGEDLRVILNEGDRGNEKQSGECRSVIAMGEEGGGK